MTLIVYSGQLIAEEICSGAKREFEQPVVGAKLEAIITLIAARGLSLGVCAYSFGNAVFSSGKRAIKIICIPLDEAFSPDAIVRTSIATALIVSLVFLRVVSSLGGFVSPELMFGVFKVHRFLFRLGLFYKSQFVHIDSHHLNPFRACIDLQRRRWELVESVLPDLIGAPRRATYRDIWRQAVRQAQEEPATASSGVVESSSTDEDVGHGVVEEEVPLDDDGTPITEEVEDWWSEDWWSPEPHIEPPVLQIDHHPVHEVPGEEDDFWRPVHVGHPVLETFQEYFSHALHRGALELCRQSLYTKDEIEDMVTAFTPAMYRATYKAIVTAFTAVKREVSVWSRDITVTKVVLDNGTKMVFKNVLLSDGRTAIIKEAPIAGGHVIRSFTDSNPPTGRRCRVEQRMLNEEEELYVDDITLADGRKIEGRDSGGLEEWKQRLLEITLLLEGMPENARAALPYYLCADEERVRRVRPDLPALSANPVLDRCFKLIVEFYTTFVAHHMPADSGALQRAFALDEIHSTALP